MQTAEKEITVIQNEVPAIVAEAEAFKVTNDLQYHEAIERGNLCKSKLQKIVDFFAPMKEAAHVAHKAICDREKAVAPGLESAKKLYTQKAADYQFKKQQEAEEKERKAREAAEAIEAKKKADLQAKIDEENKKIEEARKAGDESAAAALALKVETLEEKKESVYQAPRPVAQAPRNNAMSVQVVWEAQVVDESKVPTKWWKEVDLSRLKKAKTADKTLEVPGIKFVQKAQGAAIGRAA